MSDLEIARRAKLEPIANIGKKLGLDPNLLECYGHSKAKISFEAMQESLQRPNGKLVLVTAMSPTPAGEGKTTTSVGLADALNRLQKRTTVCLREPSMGPCFGMKGGAAGGGYAQVIPMEEINLHFTGDLHAITAANNLLAAVLDNHLHHGNTLRIDPRRVTWNRVLDLNDRALRKTVVGLGGPLNSVPRESHFDISVASEVMAVLCLSRSIQDLKDRLAKMIVGYTPEGEPVRTGQLKCHGAMTALLKDAIKPNLVQTLENNPAIIHGGPFANIAHGCNSVLATEWALKMSDYVVTEAGFGADLGAEKFLNIKCRQSGLAPDAVVIVATIRALKYHGGVEHRDLDRPDIEALQRGFDNLKKHIENVRLFGLPAVVAVNTFPTDTNEEIEALVLLCNQLDIQAVRADHWAHGGEGALELAQAVIETAENGPYPLKLLYPDEMPLWEKIETICRKIYGADGIRFEKNVARKLKEFEELGFGSMAVCMAKTQYSFSADPALRCKPTGFEIPIREVRISAGAGFLVALTGEIMTMPGLPKSPAAETIDIDANGMITGLS